MKLGKENLDIKNSQRENKEKKILTLRQKMLGLSAALALHMFTGGALNAQNKKPVEGYWNPITQEWVANPNYKKPEDTKKTPTKTTTAKYQAPKAQVQKKVAPAIDKDNISGFDNKEQTLRNKGEQGQIQETILNRKDIPEKGVWNTAEKAKESDIYYYEIARGRGEKWELVKKMKLEDGGRLYKTEAEVNEKKILNPHTGEMISKHNPKGVDLKIDGKYVPLVLGENDFIAPLPQDVVVLEHVLGGDGYVKLPKGRLVVFNADDPNCVRITWDYVCQNPIMDDQKL